MAILLELSSEGKYLKYILNYYKFNYNRSNVLDHKTYHRYTVRAKRGTIQSSRDAHQGSHKPKSAGASLRRYNEAALEQVCITVLSIKYHYDYRKLMIYCCHGNLILIKPQLYLLGHLNITNMPLQLAETHL